MRIIIDTKQDSIEEIKHIINLLTAMIGEKVIKTTEQMGEGEQRNRDIFGNIFGPVETATQKEKTQEIGEKEKTEFEDINLETY